MNYLRALTVAALVVLVVAATYFFLFDARSHAVVAAYKPASPPPAKRVQHAKLEDVPNDRSRKRVVMQPDTAKRLGIEVAEVRESMIQRKRTVTGTVAVKDGRFLIEVPLAGRTDEPTANRPAEVRAVGASGPAMTAVPAATPIATSEGGARRALFVADGSQAFSDRQRVAVSMEIGSSGLRRTVPRGALVVDAKGDTWVFVAERPLAFVRVVAKVDFIEGETAVLLDGPPAGAKVVATGAVEVYGAEGRLGL